MEQYLPVLPEPRTVQPLVLAVTAMERYLLMVEMLLLLHRLRVQPLEEALDSIVPVAPDM